MERLRIYPVEIESSSKSMPPRSLLHSIDPIGIGTPNCECLSSYINRLAAAHCLNTCSLIEKVIHPAINYRDTGRPKRGRIDDIWRRPCNGIVRQAELFTDALNRLAMRTDLANLTMLPWKDILDIGGKGLLKDEKHWCPRCFEDQRIRGETVYEKLIWQLSLTDICMIHNSSLISRCPHCAAKQRFLLGCSTIGSCSKCGKWMGGKSVPKTSCLKPTYKELVDDQDNWVEMSIGEMISISPQLPPDFGRVYLSSAINKLFEVMDGNATFLLKVMNIKHGVLNRWRYFVSMPRFDLLIDFCFRIGIAPSNFLFQNFQLEIPSPGIRQKILWVNLIKTPPAQLPAIEKQLKDILKLTPPISLKTAAKKIGIGLGVLSYRCPILSKQISKRYLSYQNRERHQKRKKVKVGTMKIILRLQKVKIPASKRIVREEMKSIIHFGNNQKADRVWREVLCELKNQARAK